MSFSVESFRRNFSGGARPNLFAGFLQAPSGMGIETGNAAQFTWLCQTAQLPGSTIGIIEQPYMGRTYKIPGNRTFEDLTTTVLIDEDFALRRLMEQWDDRINGRATNRQESVRKLAKHVNLLLVVGSKNSSNSNRLEEIGREMKIPSYLIDGPSDINKKWLRLFKLIKFLISIIVPSS